MPANFEGLFEKAPLDLDQLDQDVASLIRFYRDRAPITVADTDAAITNGTRITTQM